MTRYRIKHAHIQNLWLARTTPKQYARNGAYYNTTSVANNAWSYKHRHNAEKLLQDCIENQKKHNKDRPKGMPKPLDPITLYQIEEYEE